MGSFWGHMDEAIFFIIISVWWMLHIFPEYIRKKGKTEEIQLPFSFSRGEIFFKIAFPTGGFIAEFLADGFFNFLDEDGNFQNLQNIQHMSIYGIFIIHGLTDLFLWHGWPVLKDAHLLSIAGAFTWYGVGFFFHSRMHGKEPLESIVHLLPLPVLFGAAACGIAKIVHKEGVAIQLAFAYFVLTLGTWFFHISFILYNVNPFPGREPSSYDRTDPRNVAFAVAMFGAHICFNAIITWGIYVATYVFMIRSGRASRFSISHEEESSKYQKLSTCEDEFGVNISLDNGYTNSEFKKDGYAGC